MRSEQDSMGRLDVPDDVLFGASTQRAVLNFPVSGHRMPPRFIRSLGLLKYACARANEELGLLAREKSGWIQQVGLEIYEGAHADQFPVDVFQTGSGTSTNMNINEVLANRISQLAGQALGSRSPVHPNDDCNLGQSSNDTMPTALHLSVVLAIRDELKPALEVLHGALAAKAEAFAPIVKVGRTHLMDATPLTLGQVFSGYGTQVAKGIARMDRAMDSLAGLAIGGTAVGTGINRHPGFPQKVVAILNERTGFTFHEADNHFEAQGGRDDCVEVAGQLTVLCASLTKIANDVRLLGSGPHCGIGELRLPATQPGSSIMPGKVNPVMSEMLVQVCLYAQGLCQTVAMCGRDGHLELNATIPLIAYSLHEAIGCLSNGSQLFTRHCIEGLEADRERISAHLERSLMLVTALGPKLGYDQAAAVARRAIREGRTLREVVLEEGLTDEAELDQALDPSGMTEPH